MKTFVHENRTLFLVITLCLFLLEVEIFAVAAMKSGNMSRIEVLNETGDLIYESSASNLHEFDKYYFEQNFGPLENYRTRLVKIEKPFPFRGWFVSAIGIPVGFTLLLGFAVKAYSVFFRGESPGVKNKQNKEKKPADTQLERLIEKVSSLNIFVLGFFIVAALFLYWVLPNMIMFLSRVSIDTIVRYKWFFIAAAVTGTGIFIWFVYLKYLLARKTLESKTEIEKMKLTLLTDRELLARLPEARNQILLGDTSTIEPAEINIENTDTIDITEKEDKPS